MKPNLITLATKVQSLIPTGYELAPRGVTTAQLHNKEWETKFYIRKETVAHEVSTGEEFLIMFSDHFPNSQILDPDERKFIPLEECDWL